MIQAWIGLNHVFIIMIIAMFGYWQMAIIMLGFAVTAILGMKLLKSIDEERV